MRTHRIGGRAGESGIPPRALGRRSRPRGSRRSDDPDRSSFQLGQGSEIPLYDLAAAAIEHLDHRIPFPQNLAAYNDGRVGGGGDTGAVDFRL